MALASSPCLPREGDHGGPHLTSGAAVRSRFGSWTVHRAALEGSAARTKALVGSGNLIIKIILFASSQSAQLLLCL